MIWVNGKEITQEHFSAGELKIKLFGNGRSRVDLVWHYESDAEFFTVACIREYYATQECILYLPYLPHARMDRVKNPEDVFTLKTFAHLINSLNFEQVYVWDAHSNVGPALIDRCHDVNALAWIQEAITQLGYAKDNICLFFPDEGAQKRYGTMFPDYTQAFGIKKRNWETGKIEGYMVVGEENIKDKCVLIIDDICSYGNTFVRAAEALHATGAKEINLYVTHCEDAISKGNVFTCGLINQVFTTSSLVRSAETEEKLFHV
jgi:ribose-phosphate pyrophosphokinase